MSRLDGFTLVPSSGNETIACLLPHVSVEISSKGEPCDLSPVKNIPSECEASERECTELDDGVLHYGVNITTSRSDLFITQHLGVNQNITSLFSSSLGAHPSSSTKLGARKKLVLILSSILGDHGDSIIRHDSRPPTQDRYGCSRSASH